MNADLWSSLEPRGGNLAESTRRNQRILQSTGTVIVAAMLGRLMGFFREWLVAHKIGSNAVTDAYYAAFTLPDVVSYLVAGGVLGIIFIPIFTRYIADGKEHEGWYVFSTITTFMAIVLLILIVLGEIFAPQLAPLIAPGFNSVETATVIKLTRILLPAQVFLCIGGLLVAVQNAKARFVIPALATIIYNFVLIACAWMFVTRYGITSFAIGLVTGVFIGFFLLQIGAVWRMGGRYTPNLNLRHPGFRLFFRLALPVMLGLSVDVVDMWVIRWFGSYLLSPSITWLTYGKYLTSIPVAVIGQAVGTASYPFLARLHAEGNNHALNRVVSAGLKSLILIMLPISALAIVLSRPVVYLVFSHTQLGEQDFRATAAALAVFAVGMFARGALHVVSRGFNAAHDTITPAWIGTVFTFLSLPVYWYCVHRWQYLGLAAASSFIGIILVSTLFAFLVHRAKSTEWPSILICLGRVLVASVLGGLVSNWLAHRLELRIRVETFGGALCILLIVTAIGFPLILFMSRLLGVKEIKWYLAMMLRVPKKIVLVGG
jgi:putative peptidoglycan lipid II flippase